MSLQKLKKQFALARSYEAESLNELLDFAQYLYVTSRLSLIEYRAITKELEENGATKPDYHFTDIKEYSL